jgi:hypothetical protein
MLASSSRHRALRGFKPMGGHFAGHSQFAGSLFVGKITLRPYGWKQKLSADIG